MDNTTIKIVVNGRTYSLRAGNYEAFQHISEPDRLELLALLEAIKSQSEGLQDTGAEVNPVRGSVHQVSSPRRRPPSPLVNPQVVPVNAPERVGADSRATNPTRKGKGDIDDIMAKLILEEKSQRPVGLTKTSIYKFLGITLVLVIIVVLIF